MSNTIKVGQNWTLTLDTEQTVTGATTKQVWLKKPNGTELQIDGSIVDTTKIRVNITAAQTNVNGTWKCVAYYVTSGGAIYKGETFEQDVKNEYE